MAESCGIAWDMNPMWEAQKLPFISNFQLLYSMVSSTEDNINACSSSVLSFLRFVYIQCECTEKLLMNVQKNEEN